MTASHDHGGDRRTAILEAAAKVFLRYGYKKTSMDDLARAAGLSRQGLYLHFKTKEALFQAAILNFMEGGRIAYGAALAQSERSLFDRLLGAFEAFHGSSIGQVGDRYVGELLEATSSLLGDAPEEHERTFLADITKLLADRGEVGCTGRSPITPRELAETLCATSCGLKHGVATPAEYRDRMSVALRIVVGSDGEARMDRKVKTSRRR